MTCNWHLEDTRWEEDNTPDNVTTYSLIIDINQDEFCMIDYTVETLDEHKHEWTEANIQKAIAYCKPILNAMHVGGNLSIGHFAFPNTKFEL
jgi:hypothetical protein